MTITEYDLTELPELNGTVLPETIGTCSHEDCDLQLVTGAIWDKANDKTRAAWKRKGYRRNESAGQCRKHMVRMSPADHNEQRRLDAERRARKVAGMYRGFKQQGFRDPIGEIAHEMKIDIGSVQRFLRRAGQEYERRDERVLRREAIIEEVGFFRSLGRGLKEMATKLDLTPDELSRNLRHWKTEGYVPYDVAWLDTHDIMEYRNGYTAA
jgi:hypothetical protein